MKIKLKNEDIAWRELNGKLHATPVMSAWSFLIGLRWPGKSNMLAKVNAAIVAAGKVLGEELNKIEAQFKKPEEPPEGWDEKACEAERQKAQNALLAEEFELPIDDPLLLIDEREEISVANAAALKGFVVIEWPEEKETKKARVPAR